jgi:hypothetical protein
MAMEPAGTAVSGAPPEMPSIAAEILIVTEPYPIGDGTTDGSTHVTADRKYGRGWFSQRQGRTGRRARRSQRSE